MDHERFRRHGTSAAVMATAVLIAIGCQATPPPSAAPMGAPRSAVPAPTTAAATATPTVASKPEPVESFGLVPLAALPGNGPIVFFRTDDARMSNTPFEIAPSGRNEHPLRDGGLLPGAWSPSFEQLAVDHLVEDPSPKPGAETAWLRPAIVNRDGSGWRVLDLAPGRKMHLQPIGWSADALHLFLGSGGEDVDAADMGLYTARATDGGDLIHVYTTPPGHNEGFSLSPDRTRLLVTTSTTDDDRALFLINADGSGRIALTDPTLNVVDLEFYGGISSDWSPDGSHIVFGAQGTNASGDPPGLYVERADGTNRRLIVRPEIGAVSAQWSPTAALIAFTSKLRAGGQVWVVAPDGTGLKQLTTGTDGSTSVVPMWSPDGQSLVFQRQLHGEVTLWTMGADGASQRQLSALPLAAEYVGGYAWWPPIER